MIILFESKILFAKLLLLNCPPDGLHFQTSLFLRWSLGAEIDPNEILNTFRMFLLIKANEIFRFLE